MEKLNLVTMKTVIMKNLKLCMLVVLLFTQFYANAQDVFDQSFGENGIFSSGNNEQYDVQFQGEDKIISISNDAYDKKVILNRINLDGVLDATFGNNGVFESYGHLYGSWNLVVDSEQNIYFASCNEDTIKVTKVTQNGTLDVSFGNNGHAELLISSVAENLYLNKVAIDNNGKLIAYGDCKALGSNDRFIVARFNHDGSIDTNFGENGLFLNPVIPNQNVQRNSGKTIVNPDNSIIVSGYVIFPGDVIGPLAVKIKSDGTIDDTFGENGIYTATLAGYSSFRGGILMDDNSIILCGAGSNTSATEKKGMVTKLSANGELDISFGNNGYADCFSGGEDTIVSYYDAILVDDEIIVTGDILDVTPFRRSTIITKLNLDGTMVDSYGENGTKIINSTSEQRPSIRAFAIEEKNDEFYCAGSLSNEDTQNKGILFKLINDSATSNMTFTTTKSIGETIFLQINAADADQSSVWIDLNGNNTEDSGEGNISFGSVEEYTLGSQTITIYGKVTYLKCNYNKISTLDVSNNTNLTELNCFYNNLSTLDVSNNTNLTTLQCSSNNLSTLDVSNNTNLTSLQCSFNNLSTLDVSNNTNLTYLNCLNINISTLDVSNNINLTYLNCSKNNLSSLAVSNNTNLTKLFCYSNNLSTLDVSNNTNLTRLLCYSNNLSTLDVSNNPNLTELSCENNNINSLNVGNNPNITILNCEANNISSLDVNNNTNLTKLECNDNNISSLDVSNNANLTYLNCSNNQLTYLNIANGYNGNFVHPSYSYHEAVDATDNPNLTCIKVDLSFVPPSSGNDKWLKDHIAKWRNDGTDCETSISQLDDVSIQLYPNPASDQINIYVPDSYIHNDMVIYNLLGQSLMRIPLNDTNQSIDISNLKSGVYIVKIGQNASKLIIN